MADCGLRICICLSPLSPLAAEQLPGQSARVDQGDSLFDAHRPAEALQVYNQVLRSDSSATVLWKAAQAAADVAKLAGLGSAEGVGAGDSMYAVAAALARRAIDEDSLDPNGHFMLAMALGRLSRGKGGRERLRYGRLIYDAAATTLRLDSTHDGAHHVLGAWHAEVMRLSSTTRFIARTLFGAGIIGRASWDSAVAHLEQAVELRPDHVYHRLELAEIYADRKRWADARGQLLAIPPLPADDVLDEWHKSRAAGLLEEITGKT